MVINEVIKASSEIAAKGELYLVCITSRESHILPGVSDIKAKPGESQFSNLLCVQDVPVLILVNQMGSLKSHILLRTSSTRMSLLCAKQRVQQPIEHRFENDVRANCLLIRSTISTALPFRDTSRRCQLVVTDLCTQQASQKCLPSLSKECISTSPVAITKASSMIVNTGATELS